jgi:hypothetical protein
VALIDRDAIVEWPESKRFVTSRMIAAMPHMAPFASLNGMMENSTEIRAQCIFQTAPGRLDVPACGMVDASVRVVGKQLHGRVNN